MYIRLETKNALGEFKIYCNRKNEKLTISEM